MGNTAEDVLANGAPAETSSTTRQMRQFGTGATRDACDDKYDFEGFLSPEVLEMFASYMHKHRKQADGNLRDSDNWQKGIPKDAYMKSAFRHFMDWWKQHRGLPGQDKLEESLSALMFNVMGYMFEVIRERKGARVTPEAAPTTASE